MYGGKARTLVTIWAHENTVSAGIACPLMTFVLVALNTKRTLEQSVDVVKQWPAVAIISGAMSVPGWAEPWCVRVVSGQRNAAGVLEWAELWFTVPSLEGLSLLLRKQFRLAVAMTVQVIEAAS